MQPTVYKEKCNLLLYLIYWCIWKGKDAKSMWQSSTKLIRRNANKSNKTIIFTDFGRCAQYKTALIQQMNAGMKESSHYENKEMPHSLKQVHIWMLFCLYDLFQSHNMTTANITPQITLLHISLSLLLSLFLLPPLLLPHSFDSVLRSARSSSQHLISSFLTLCIRLSSASQQHLNRRCNYLNKPQRGRYAQ